MRRIVVFGMLWMMCCVAMAQEDDEMEPIMRLTGVGDVEELDAEEVERLLRRLRPAALPARLVGQLGVSMYLEAQRRRHPLRQYLQRGGLAAAIVFFLVAGGVMLAPGSAVAEGENPGHVGRNIITSRGAARVEWRRGDAPVRHYTVLYEDSFVLDAEDTTTVIRVPNTTDVEVEEDYL
jgi:hypothetical protein